MDDRTNPTATDHGLMEGFPPPADRRVTQANWQDPPYNRWGFQHVRELTSTTRIGRGRGEPSALPEARRDLDDIGFTSAEGSTRTVAEMLATTWTDGFLVLHRGAIVDERYFNGMQPDSRHLWMSCTKTLTSALCAVQVGRGRIDPDAPATNYVPELAGSAFGDATVRHVLDMTVGIDFSEAYEDPEADIWITDRIYGMRPAREGDPVSICDYATTVTKKGEHGEKFHYVSLCTDVLGWILERATGTRFDALLERDLWSRLGADHEGDLVIDGVGSAMADGGFNSTLRDFARFGLLLARKGVIDGERLLPETWIDDILENGDPEGFAKSEYAGVLPNAAYRSQCWVTRPGTDTLFLALGIHGQMIYVDPHKDIVVAKFSTHPKPAEVGLALDAFHAAHAIASVL